MTKIATKKWKKRKVCNWESTFQFWIELTNKIIHLLNGFHLDDDDDDDEGDDSDAEVAEEE